MKFPHIAPESKKTSVLIRPTFLLFPAAWSSFLSFSCQGIKELMRGRVRDLLDI